MVEATLLGPEKTVNDSQAYQDLEEGWVAVRELNYVIITGIYST